MDRRSPSPPRYKRLASHQTQHIPEYKRAEQELAMWDQVIALNRAEYRQLKEYREQERTAEREYGYISQEREDLMARHLADLDKMLCNYMYGRKKASTRLMGCSVCDKGASVRCGGCAQVAYCGEACARADWANHRCV